MLIASDGLAGSRTASGAMGLGLGVAHGCRVKSVATGLPNDHSCSEACTHLPLRQVRGWPNLEGADKVGSRW